MTRLDYSREELITLCERAIVPESRWCDRDSQSAHVNIGTAWALLKAGCEFRVLDDDDRLKTNDETIWIEIRSRGFGAFEWGDESDRHYERDTAYIPTQKRLDATAGGDWY